MDTFSSVARLPPLQTREPVAPVPIFRAKLPRLPIARSRHQSRLVPAILCPLSALALGLVAIAGLKLRPCAAARRRRRRVLYSFFGH